MYEILCYFLVLLVTVQNHKKGVGLSKQKIETIFGESLISLGVNCMSVRLASEFLELRGQSDIIAKNFPQNSGKPK